MDAYVARQPIFDRKKSLFAYELLFRDGLDNYMPTVEGDVATTKLLSSSFFTIGIDKVSGGKRSFINFTQNLLESHIPLLFPRETTIVEILEDVNPEENVIEACKKISASGYSLALDDFVFKKELKPLTDIADIIKVDFRLSSRDEIKEILHTVGRKKIKFLAEKVETNDEFNDALEMGFEYFQGYFFSKPEIIKGKDIPTTSLQYLNFMVALSKSHYDLNELEAIMSRDVAMSYKLLSYVNSAFFKRGADITSLKQALLILGKDEISRLVSLIGMSKLAAHKPDELVKSACIKARLCEKLGNISGCAATRDELFILGLFSNLDAILDQPMNYIMDKLPLAASIKNALVNKTGHLADFLFLVEFYEQGKWDGVKEYAMKSCVIEKQIPDIYLEACEWANTFVS